ncbi:MAG: imidazole glycerol phosphate synthase subunit HisH [Thermoproteota archaeon]|nr:imidazole glycerol phosphate synthase subunit HisH [Thermoproteota archaeon]
MPKIAIFDYGSGNLFNLQQSLLRNGAHNVDIVNTFSKVEDYDGVVLPGVGNFDNAIESIKNHIGPFMDAIDNGTPILGICLGLEMLFYRSEEGTMDGLKVLYGDVVMLPKIKVKVPHMGWNNLETISPESKLLDGVKDGSWVYFVHSYRINPTDKSIIIATSQYGGNLSVAVEQENVIGTQFHPEKSGAVGSRIIRNYIEMCSGKK